MSSSLLSLDIKNLKLPRWLLPGAPADTSGGGLSVSYPPVAVEMGSTQLALARLTRDKDRKWNLSSHDTVAVPPERSEERRVGKECRL